MRRRPANGQRVRTSQPCWNRPLSFVQGGIAAATLLALAMIVLSAWLAWRQWGFGSQDPPHDDPTAHDRTLFQGFATLLLSGLSFLAVLYVALPLLFIDGCAS